jgi:hypothetical protein
MMLSVKVAGSGTGEVKVRKVAPLNPPTEAKSSMIAPVDPSYRSTTEAVSGG